MFDNFVYEKQCLTSEECQEVIQYFEESDDQSPGKVEHGYRPEHKDCVEINPCLYKLTMKISLPINFNIFFIQV